MRISTAIIGAAAMAGAVSVASPASAVAVYAKYGSYNISSSNQFTGPALVIYNDSDQVFSGISDAFYSNDSTVSIYGPVGNVFYSDYGLPDLLPGQTFIDGPYGAAVPGGVSLSAGGKSYSLSFTLPNMGSGDAPVYLGDIGPPSATATVAAVPEPATWGLMILGFAGVGTILRSRSRPSGAVRA